MQLDFAKIRDYPITDIAAMLGLTLEEKGEQLVGTCPISKANNATAFKITPSKNRWICFCSACKKLDKPGGDCIELVRRVRGLDGPRPAAEIIQTHFNGAGKLAATPELKQEVSSPSQASKFDPLTYLASLSQVHDDLGSLDISPQTLEAFKAGYCGKGLHRGRLAFGLVDSKGEIPGFASTALDGKGELLFPKGYTVPYYTDCQMVEEGEVHLFDNVIHAMEAYENGVRSLVILLRPINADTLKCLSTLMEERNCTTLEICY